MLVEDQNNAAMSYLDCVWSLSSAGWMLMLGASDRSVSRAQADQHGGECCFSTRVWPVID